MLSIIIPCYNAVEILRRQLPPFMDYLQKKSINYEMIVVDDGSTDADSIQSVARDYHCVYLKNEKNMGKGAAVRKGMLHAKGEYRLFTDVDIPFEYDAIEQFLYYLDFGKCDVVVGDRTLPQSTYFKKIPILRQWGSRSMSFMIGSFVTSGHFDTQCGLKGFRGHVADDLFGNSYINGFAFDAELLYIALKRHYNIKRLPVVLRCNESNSVKLLCHGLQMVKDIVRIQCNHILGRYK
ncbi:MAG: glycosyltransferase [Candidatus Omnitrophica bacterium]|nr:glycosyltransferase [Candidatus Omnitrophota bacterium]